MIITFDTNLDQLVINTGTELDPINQVFGPDDVESYLAGDPNVRTLAERQADVQAMGWETP